MVGMEGAPRVPMLQLPGLPTVQQQASMTRQASQQSAASGPLPPMTTPRDVMVSSEHLAPASIFELRTALRAAKGAAAPDGTVTLTLAVADGLHALLVDHAKMSDAKRGLLSDKKALEDRVRSLKKRVAIAAREQAALATLEVPPPGTAPPTAASAWPLDAHLARLAPSQHSNSHASLALSQHSTRDSQGALWTGDPGRTEWLRSSTLQTNASADRLTFKSDDLSLAEQDTLARLPSQPREIGDLVAEQDRRVVELEQTVSVHVATITRLQKKIADAENDSAPTRVRASASWFGSTSPELAGKGPSLAGDAVEDEVLGQLVHTKMRLAVLEEEMDNLRGELAKAHKDKARCQQQAAQLAMLTSDLQAHVLDLQAEVDAHAATRRATTNHATSMLLGRRAPLLLMGSPSRPEPPSARDLQLAPASRGGAAARQSLLGCDDAGVAALQAATPPAAASGAPPSAALPRSSSGGSSSGGGTSSSGSSGSTGSAARAAAQGLQPPSPCTHASDDDLAGVMARCADATAHVIVSPGGGGGAGGWKPLQATPGVPAFQALDPGDGDLPSALSNGHASSVGGDSSEHGSPAGLPQTGPGSPHQSAIRLFDRPAPSPTSA